MNEYVPGSVWQDADGDLWAVADDGRFVLIHSKSQPITSDDYTLSLEDADLPESYGPLFCVFDGRVI